MFYQRNQNANLAIPTHPTSWNKTIVRGYRCRYPELHLRKYGHLYVSSINPKVSYLFLLITKKNQHEPRNVGALAELFDISCLGKTPLFNAMPDIAIAAWNAAPPTITAAQLISKLQPFKNSEVLGGWSLF